ncbi:MAG: CBS domain-containing protein [Myxococcales bacterium]|nr:CBS domain-containing protein [Myxococcales bacterium]
MGEQNVSSTDSDVKLRAFVKALLEDLRALERMIEGDMFETGIRRVGAEQEMFLVDNVGHPAPVAPEVLAKLQHPQFTTELARFNLEANLTPYVFGDNCLSRMETELHGLIAVAREGAAACGANVVLCGILPSLRQSDLGLNNMTPNPRYFALNQAISELRGGKFQTLIKGVDEINVTHDNVMLEACNTSFQLHFQVGPSEFAKLYNVAQLVTAPVLAAATNSPLLLGHRLWRETRIALFQQSVDARSSVHQERGQRTRVSFGDSWVHDSILEIFKEDIARFRVVLATEVPEKALAVLASGQAPLLYALRLHNGTVYRWNRPCYGVMDGIPHLRIENRALPSGPSVVDEVANAAFYFGLMSQLTEEYAKIHELMDFDDAKANFLAAARHGLKAQFTWVDGKTHTAANLILDELLPKARAGLVRSKIDGGDIDKYLGIIEERVSTTRTGAAWMLSAIAGMGRKGTLDHRQRALVMGLLARQAKGDPVHTWDLATLDETEGWRESYRVVGQFMTTDMFTVRPVDLVDLAIRLMEWHHLRYVPVEDDHGLLVGVVTYRAILRLAGNPTETTESVAVSDIMRKNPITVSPDTRTVDAIRLMRDKKVGCLPVVRDGRLVGIITETDLVRVASQLLETYLDTV